MALKIGDKAPDILLPDQKGVFASLKDFRGKWIVVYFYPRDLTPGCTVEAKDFSKKKDQFELDNAIIFGISPDPPGTHCQFIEKEKLTIRLLSDSDKAVLKAYNAWGEKSMYGKLFFGVLRSTFLVDPMGKIAWIWPKVKPEGHAQEVKKKLEELQKIKHD